MSFPDAASAMVPNGRRHPRWHVLAPFPASVSLVRLLLLPRMVAMYRVLVGLSARRRVSVTLLLHRTPIAQARMGSQYGAKGARLPQYIRPQVVVYEHVGREQGGEKKGEGRERRVWSNLRARGEKAHHHAGKHGFAILCGMCANATIHTAARYGCERAGQTSSAHLFPW